MTQKPPVDHSISEHIQIVKNIYHGRYGSHGLEKWIEISLCVIKIIMPGLWIRIIAKWDYKLRNMLLEGYMIAKLVVLLYLLLNGVENNIAVFFAVYFGVDIVQHLLWLISLSNVYTTMPKIKNNFAHLVINMIEIVLCFSLLYFHFHAIWKWVESVRDPIGLVYFSMVTFATVWYGDIWPITDVGRILVATQIAVSFLFISIVCNSFVSQLNIKED